MSKPSTPRAEAADIAVPDSTAEALAVGLSADVYAAGMAVFHQSDMVQAAMNAAGYRAPDTEPKLGPDEIESTPGEE